jgi:hypothetical protein
VARHFLYIRIRAISLGRFISLVGIFFLLISSVFSPNLLFYVVIQVENARVCYLCKLKQESEAHESHPTHVPKEL